MKVVQGAGKLFGKAVAVSKNAPAKTVKVSKTASSKTMKAISTAKNDLVAGFNQGAQRTSDSDVIDIK
jgi:hypothetical protein